MAENSETASAPQETNPYASGEQDGTGTKEQVTIYVIKFAQEVCDRDSQLN